MPVSSEAITGRFNPTFVPKQDYNRAPLQAVNVSVNDLNEIPSASTGTYSTKKMWIAVGLTVSLLAVGAGIGIPLALSHSQSSSTGGTSPNHSSVNNTSNTTTGSSNANSTTLSTTSLSTVSNSAGTGSTASTIVSTGSTASTTISTSSVSSATTVAAGFSAGGAVLSSTTAWYGYEQVTINCTANLNNITITIIVQRTVNATYSGAFSTFWGGTMNQAYSTTGTQIIYTWTIVSGQTIQSSGSPYQAQAQFSLFGVSQITSADTYQITATTVGGVTSSFSGHF